MTLTPKGGILEVGGPSDTTQANAAQAAICEASDIHNNQAKGTQQCH